MRSNKVQITIRLFVRTQNLNLLMVDLKINEALQTGAVENRTYRGTKADPPSTPYQEGKLGNRTYRRTKANPPSTSYQEGKLGNRTYRRTKANPPSTSYQEGKLGNRTYRRTKANPPSPPYQGGTLGNRTYPDKSELRQAKSRQAGSKSKGESVYLFLVFTIVSLRHASN